MHQQAAIAAAEAVAQEKIFGETKQQIMLLKSQKNELLNIMSEKGISVNDFEPLVENPEFFTIRLKNSIFYFSLSHNHDVIDGGYVVNSSPKTEIPAFFGFDWKGVLRNFAVWTDEMRLEIDTPDLWAEAAKTAQLFAPSATPSDDKFTRTELTEVQAQLRVLAQGLATAALPEAARQKLIELTYSAAVAAETSTKRDWVGILASSFTGAVFSLALNPTQISEVLKLVKAAFGGLFLH